MRTLIHFIHARRETSCDGSRVRTTSASSMRRSLALCALVLSTTVGCHRAGADVARDAADDPVINATVVEVVEKPMPRYLALTGSLAPNESSDVAANASGAVLETLIERGSLVKKGDVLAKLDARSAALTAAEADAMSAAAKSQLATATTECDRLEKLLGAGAITGAEYDRQHGACTTAQFNAKAAAVRAQSAYKLVGDANVRAPFAGMISDKWVSTGEYVRPDSKVARVVAIDPLRLEITVPEASVQLVKVGLAVDFKVSSLPDDKYKGSIRYVGPSLRIASRDLVVEAVVANADHKLRPGMFATARIELGDRNALVIPKSAIREDGSLRRVFAVIEGRTEERLVKLGEERDGFFVVEQGLKIGEKVVAPVTHDVRDGARLSAGK